MPIFSFFVWAYRQQPILFIFTSGLTLNCQYFSFLSRLTFNCQYFLFLHLGLHSTASTFQIFVHFIFSSGLTLNCQFFSSFFFPLTWTDLRVSVRLCFDFITHVYLIGLTPLVPALLIFFEKLWFVWITFFLPKVFLKLLLGTRPPFFVSLFQMTYIWCNVSCNVRLCMNEMSLYYYFFNLFHSFSSFLVSNKI